ncbi:hypothetical protein IFM89_006072 [Coptis chinensis]|uniref:non-specific serine/threonine protein kinase n=1 Tax=Coptis chinensis TaxID=261450 RepID=A0A835H345_9MAGN|nr:hypothetical protein IFM89_006072 [Coptis chinensis]
MSEASHLLIPPLPCSSVLLSLRLLPFLPLLYVPVFFNSHQNSSDRASSELLSGCFKGFQQGRPLREEYTTIFNMTELKGYTISKCMIRASGGISWNLGIHHAFNDWDIDGLASLMASVDTDHLALMMELLGMMPRKIALGGRYSRDFFNRYGDLRHIRRLRFWPLNKVLMEKYEFSEQDANDMADFLVPILDFVPEKRPTAAQCLLHPWISARPRLVAPSLASFQTQPTDGHIPEEKGERHTNGDSEKDESETFEERENDEKKAYENLERDQREAIEKREKVEREAMEKRDKDEIEGFDKRDKDEREAIKKEKDEGVAFEKREKTQREAIKEEKDESQAFEQRKKDQREAIKKEKDENQAFEKREKDQRETIKKEKDESEAFEKREKDQREEIKKREKVEREAMEMCMGNIAIDGALKMPMKNPQQPSTRPAKATGVSSSR